MIEQQETLRQLGRLFTVPDADIEELDKVYLHIITAYLIHLADARFRQEGRGVVLLDIPDTVASDGDTPEAIVRAYYLSQAKARSSGLSWRDRTLTQELQTYNPQTETLICITHAPTAYLYRLKLHKRVSQRRSSAGVSAVSARVSRIVSS